MTRLTVARVLCLWLPLLVASALARPKGQDTAVTLDITSSVLKGQPLFGDTLGPYTEGQDLTLTCSTNDPTVTLTWWEGKEELKAEPQRSQEMSSTSLTLERISVADSDRKLSCKGTESDVVKTIILKVVKDTAVTLDITSSVLQDRPQFGDTLGPYTEGQDLTLTCSTNDPTVTLTWWEGKEELKTEPQRFQEMSSTSLTLERISVSDSDRKLSCMATEAGVVKTITLKVVKENALDIVVDDKALRHDEPTITAHAGATVKLTCISQGYSSSSTSWFVDNTELESKTRKSLYASSNVLTIPDITTKDTGRRFSCRSEGTEPDRTVELLVYRDETVDHGRDHHGDDAQVNTVNMLGIILIFVAVAIGAVMIITISAGIMYLFKAGYTSKNNYKVMSPSHTNI